MKLVTLIILFTSRDSVADSKTDSRILDDGLATAKKVESQSNDVPEIDSRIVGGFQVPIKDIPHTAYYEVMCAGEVYECGASILNQNLLLTAAHCLESCEQGDNIRISLGNSHKAHGFIYNGDKFIIHEHYNTETLDNDIGMIYSKRHFVFGPNVQRVAVMSHAPILQHHEYVLVAGWGVVDEETEHSEPYVKGAIQTYLPDGECNDYLSEDKPQGTFCTIANKNTNLPLGYAARGDSGGPLIMRDYIQIGLVSFKDDTRPDVVVYTNISYQYSWIIHNARSLCCSK